MFISQSHRPIDTNQFACAAVGVAISAVLRRESSHDG